MVPPPLLARRCPPPPPSLDTRPQARGQFFVGVGDDVYANQIVGINAKTDDLKVNICKKKHLDNMRAAGKDQKDGIASPLPLTLEEAVEYVVHGEFVEVTPDAVRMGVYHHDPSAKRRAKAES